MLGNGLGILALTSYKLSFTNILILKSRDRTYKKVSHKCLTIYVLFIIFNILNIYYEIFTWPLITLVVSSKLSGML